MSFRIFPFLPAAVLALGALLLAPAGDASAHEQRKVGDFDVEVGFLVEPAVVKQLNGAFIHVEKSGEPVEGLDESLKVELIVGGAAAEKTVDFAAIEGEAGSYVARFIPTVVGDYTFHITGDLKGTSMDESFSSGPGRFDSVKPLSDVEFPAGITSDPLAKTVQDLQSKVDGLSSGGSDSTARTLAVIGIVAGVAGLAVGGFGLTRRRG